MGKIVLSDKTEIELREPVVQDMLAVEHIEGDQAKEVELIANLSGIPSDTIKKMKLKDYAKLSKELQGFLS